MADHTVTVESTLEALLVEKKYSTIRDILSTMNPADIASVFDGLEESRLPLLFRRLPKELAAETFVEMEPDAQELLIRGFSDSELREVLDELYVDDAVDIVEEMPANVVRRILSQADPDMRKDINEILRYPENSAGSIMTTEYVSLRPGMTVEEAILRIRLSDWFCLNLNINNMLTAITCRKHGFDKAGYIVGDNEVAQALRTSNARDFGLGDTVDYLPDLWRIAEETDLMVREKKVDLLKWEWLEEHTFFKPFDIESVFAYLLKLEMIERWVMLDKATGEKTFREIVGAMKKGSEHALEEFGKLKMKN